MQRTGGTSTSREQAGLLAAEDSQDFKQYRTGGTSSSRVMDHFYKRCGTQGIKMLQ